MAHRHTCFNKEFNFNNFKESQNFTNKVGEIAEKEGHHPSIFLLDERMECFKR